MSQSPATTKPVIDVFIVHWNRPQECLNTIRAFQGEQLALQISVVDNASDAHNFKSLQDGLPPGIALIQLPENRGWGGGLNVLLNEWLHAKQSSLCFISAHDALPKGGCLRDLVAAMQANPALGIVCPEYGKPELPKFSPVRGARLVAVSSRPTGMVEPVPFAHGTLMLLKRACLQEIGLFDERYFAYGDETEIGLRARARGWGVAVVWGAVVINPGSWTPSPLLGYLWARSSLLMARTYGGWTSAIFRACLIVARNAVLSFRRTNRTTLSSPVARIFAVRDFLLNRFGSPSPQLRARLIAKPSTVG